MDRARRCRPKDVNRGKIPAARRRLAAGGHQKEKKMFKGKAELLDPETGKAVATFTEDGEKMKVVLKQPQTLSGTTRLAIYGTEKNEELIAIAATGGTETTVHEFHGTSPLGSLSNGAAISLTRSPGGPLGTLLEVLGRGTVHEDKHGTY
jgi:hypothetical protein